MGCISAGQRGLLSLWTESRGSSRWRVEVGWQKWGMREHLWDLCSGVLNLCQWPKPPSFGKFESNIKETIYHLQGPSPLSQLKAPQGKSEWERISTGPTPMRGRTGTIANTYRCMEFVLLFYYPTFIHPIPINQSRKWKHKRWMSNLTYMRWVD